MVTSPTADGQQEPFFPLRFAVLTPLQDRVANLGVCPKCHAKTLELKHVGGGCDWHQCRKCITVFALESKP